VAAALAGAAELAPTPAQPRGPFYPKSFPAERDPDLARVGDREAQGEILHVAGRVLARDGSPVAGARVEIWQTNGHGRYHHEDDASPAPFDPGFQGWGQSSTDAAGGYRFRTVVPVAYSGRTPHVHFAVSVPGRRPFITQMYLADAPENAGDFLVRRLDAEARARLMVKLEPAAGGQGKQARFDIVLP
jgi:protocatechuate 3,4-dioxygenase beta subunit